MSLELSWVFSLIGEEPDKKARKAFGIFSLTHGRGGKSAGGGRGAWRELWGRKINCPLLWNTHVSQLIRKDCSGRREGTEKK